jgi:diaminopimelate decarboxylase
MADITAEQSYHESGRTPGCSGGPEPVNVPAYLHESIDRLLRTKTTLLGELVNALGSPLNIIFPENIRDNVAAFHEAFRHHTLDGQVFLSSKPNKSLAVLREASVLPVGVDVSSEGSLAKALACGIHPRRIQATGPKNRNYLTLCLLQDVLINVDSLQELEQIVDLRQSLSPLAKTRIMIRLTGFKSSRIRFTNQDSTFGTSVEDTAAIFELLRKYKDEYAFEGFSYHINSSLLDERIVALENTLELTFESLKLGFAPKAVNIGGGFRINYVKDALSWRLFIEALKESVLGTREALTWNNSGLGYKKEKGKIKGSPTFMDHYVPSSAGDDLCNLISQPLPSYSQNNAGRLLSESMLKLYIEPGRAILNQVGITVARVLGHKTSTLGERLVVLEMNRSNLNSSELKLITDPVVIPMAKNSRQQAPRGVYYAGNLCVHNELIQHKKHYPDFLPEAEDLVVFVNTAPYMMDFVESETLNQPVAKKVAISAVGGDFKWTLDDKYRPGSAGKGVQKT